MNEVQTLVEGRLVEVRNELVEVTNTEFKDLKSWLDDYVETNQQLTQRMIDDAVFEGKTPELDFGPNICLSDVHIHWLTSVVHHMEDVLLVLEEPESLNAKLESGLDLGQYLAVESARCYLDDDTLRLKDGPGE